MEIMQLAYVSESAYHMEESEILAILKQACPKNRARGITGLLVYNGGHFLQMLEGPPGNVIECFETIKMDRRHRDIHQFYENRLVARTFARWSMAYKNHEVFEPFLRTQVEIFLRRCIKSNFVVEQESAIELFRLFAKTW